MIVVCILYIFVCVLWGNVCNEINKRLYPSLQKKWLHNGLWIAFNAMIAPISLIAAVLRGVNELDLESKEE